MEQWVDYWFVVITDGGDLEGEEFLVEVRNDIDAHDMAWDIACENFPNEDLRCYGRISVEEAEMLGLDTY